MNPVVFIVFLSFFLGTEAAAQPLPQPPVPRVSFYRGNLSVGATEIPLKEILDAIKKRSGISVELRDPEAARQTITVNITNQPLEQALGRILRGFSFLFSYDGKRLSGVVVLSRKEFVEPTSVVRIAPGSSNADSMPDFPELLRKNPEEGLKAITQALNGNGVDAKLVALDSLRSVNDSRALALLGAALGDSNSNVKRVALGILMEKNSPEAVRILAGALKDRDPSFRIEILQALADKGQTQALTSALSDQNRQVRETAKALLESQEQQ